VPSSLKSFSACAAGLGGQPGTESTLCDVRLAPGGMNPFFGQRITSHLASPLGWGVVETWCAFPWTGWELNTKSHLGRSSWNLVIG
jgi:hypothetical protein